MPCQGVSQVTIGDRCLLLLPRQFITPHKTAGKGLITNILLDRNFLILIEEIWHYKFFGWVEVPHVLKERDYLFTSASPNNVKTISEIHLDNFTQLTLRDYILWMRGEEDERSGRR